MKVHLISQIGPPPQKRRIRFYFPDGSYRGDNKATYFVPDKGAQVSFDESPSNFYLLTAVEIKASHVYVFLKPLFNPKKNS